MLGSTGVYEARKEVGSLIHGVTGDDSAERVSYDECATAGRVGLIAWKGFEELYQTGRVDVRGEAPIVAPIMGTSGVEMLIRSETLEEAAGDVTEQASQQEQ